MFHKIVHGKYHFNHAEFKCVSDEAKDLIKRLLETDPKKRYSASQALQHPFFSESTSEKKGAVDGLQRLDSNVIKRLQSFRG